MSLRPRPPGRFGHRLLALTLALAVTALSGCGDGDDDTAADTTTTTTTAMPTTTTTVPGTTTTTAFEGQTTPASTPSGSTGDGPALLTDVRVARHPGFDRVVFEFRDDTLPGYDVGFDDPPFRSAGEGAVVEVEGEAHLSVRMEFASGVDLSGEDVEPTYTGPTRFSPPDTGVVVELVRTGDFEGNIEWVVGLAQMTTFRVETATQPARLVIDVGHP